jgi:hypothetical protein
MNDIKIGDLITYRTFSGEDRKVTVTNVTDNIKNGRAGFDGIIVGWPTDYVWGYNTQIIEILTKENK